MKVVGNVTGTTADPAEVVIELNPSSASTNLITSGAVHAGLAGKVALTGGEMTGPLGFTQFEPTFNATTTEVDFDSDGNKAYVELTGNIATLKLKFPDYSGSFMVVLKQDGTGSRSIVDYKAFTYLDAAATVTDVAFPGRAVGGTPTLTSDANYVDILSIYWDNEHETAFGSMAKDFAF